MKRNLYQFLSILFSFTLLLFCAKTRLKAANYSFSAMSLNSDLYDPWYDEIFESREFHNLVVSIQAEEQDLYSEEYGILSGLCAQQGRNRERPIQIFVYQNDGTPLIMQHAGIRVSGATSRNAVRKSFRIIARKEYDRLHPHFSYDLWEGRRFLDGTDAEIKEYDSFILHSMRLAMDATGIHNSVGYSLAKKAGIEDASPTTPTAVYLNGVYQGAYFIIPSKNAQALAELYHIENADDIETVSVFEAEKTGFQNNPEVLDDYLSFVNYLQNCDINNPDTIAEIEKQLDVEQCLEYYAVNLLLGNGDWLDNNLRVWRCRNNGLPFQDGKWRYFLFDLDWIGSFPELVRQNFIRATQSKEDYNILPCLLQNPEYLARFKEILSHMEETAFHPETIEAVFAEEEARMHHEASFDFQSEAFDSYLLYSFNSEPLAEEDYITLEDRQYLIEDFKNHLLKTAGIINECITLYYPEQA